MLRKGWAAGGQKSQCLPHSVLRPVMLFRLRLKANASLPRRMLRPSLVKHSLYLAEDLMQRKEIVDIYVVVSAFPRPNATDVGRFNILSVVPSSRLGVFAV